jgi:hypothetical protein
VFLLAMLGLGLSWSRWRKENAILLAVFLSVFLPYIATHVEARYLLPAAFIYFIWIGLGVEIVVERVVERGGRRFRTSAAAIRA